MTTNKKVLFNYSIIMILALIITRNLAASSLNNSAGFFLLPVSKSLNIDVGLLSLTYSVGSITRIIFLPMAGHLVNKYSMKLLMTIAIIMQTIGFSLLGIMDQFWQWYLCYIPIAMGGTILVSLSAPILIHRWFKTKAATVLGIVIASYGIIGAITQPMIINLIASNGWRKTYLGVGISIGLFVLLVISLFIKDKPNNLDTVAKQINPPTKIGITINAARRSIAFYSLIIFGIAMTCFASFGQLMEPFGLSLGFSAKDMESIISIMRIGNTLGALTIGIMAQRLGVLKTTIFNFSLIIIAIVCLLLINNNINLLRLGALLFGCTGISIPILAPLLTADIFGHKDYNLIYSNIMMGPPLASVITIPLYGFIYDQLHSYALVLYMIFIFIFVALLAILITWYKRPILNEESI